MEVVLAASAGDDATAALTMILRYHRKPVTFGEVRQAIYRDGSATPHAGHVITAAEQFRLRGAGLRVEHAAQLARLAVPAIAHMLVERGPFPRPGLGGDGFFAILVEISPRRVRWIDPYAGEIEEDRGDFLAHASGVFLVFEPADPLPRAAVASRA